MESAIESHSTDLIGLGRPLCLEPDFCKQILNGSMSESKYIKIPSVFRLTMGIAKQSIQDMAKGTNPTDYSTPENIELIKSKYGIVF